MAWQAVGVQRQVPGIQQQHNRRQVPLSGIKLQCDGQQCGR